MSNTDNVLKVMGDLKSLKRRGWILRSCVETESDADHSWGVAFLVMIYTPSHLDKKKCLELALIHDLAEIRAGDITPNDECSLDEKKQKEMDAIFQISKELDRPELKILFEEFEKQETKEALFVRDLDKIDMMMQLRYFIENSKISKEVWSEFYQHSKEKIKTQEGKSLFEKVCKKYV